MKTTLILSIGVCCLIMFCVVVDPVAAVDQPPLFRPTASNTIAPLDNTTSKDIMDFLGLDTPYENATASKKDYGGLISGLFSVYSDVLGPIALLIVFAMPFAALWIMQRDMLIPGGIGLMFSSFILIKLPADFQAVAVLMMAVSVAGVIYAMYTRR